ncbi:hypothetical protein BLA60_40285 [Actinophytocola xinjiangensis]|uniref:OmpR/PhoB-type domain-containing protein n=1 Tax=Actinophytocola xinjiangensis TaxID=485602 RepID=A0A7Z0WFY0_9PSEU|nr:BTAD domain-containing putative transcriptional regulator [Actinophytocola xinjiangensis]OLF04532.1 hypothetical protein BLA60_40285 [Actinophytocola xinjiangensis]
MWLRVLGPVHLTRAGVDVPAPAGLRGTLLAILLAAPNELVPVGVLVESLWPDAPVDLDAQRLQIHISRLRGLLGDAERITFEHGGYRLRVAPGELDAQRFTTLLDEATQLAGDDPRRCATLVDTALDLWRGPPFGGLDTPVLAAEAARLTELRHFAVELRCEAALRLGRHAAIVAELTDLVAEHPLRERLQGLLMTALYRSGRQAEALEVYRAARTVLVDELGLEPGPELRAIETQILNGDPVTAVAPAGGTPPVPAQLPYRTSGFVGRDRELAELDAGLDRGDPLWVVAGTAGVGKTALAVHWSQRVRDRFPDGQLFVDLRGYDQGNRPVTAHEALGRLLEALGAALPHDLDERAARWRTLVAGRRILLVLDNAATVDQVRPLLPGTPSVLALVTSRQALPGLAAREGARRLDLDRLPAGDAHILLRTLIGGRRDAGADQIDELTGRCARLPLALRVAAELVNSRPGTGIAELNTEIADAADALDLLDVDGDDQASVRAVLSWSYRGLPPDAARLFRHHGLRTGHDLDTHALAALAGTDPRGVRRPLEVLVRGNLLERADGGRFRSHDLLRAYALELAAATETDAQRDAARDRLFTYYLHAAARAMDVLVPLEASARPALPADPGVALPDFADAAGARAWLDRERPNLVAATRHATGAAPTLMAGVTWRYLLLGGHFDDAETLQTLALAAARRHGDDQAQGNALRVLGLVFGRYQGQTDRALRYTEQALAVYTRTGHVYGQAASMSNLGDLMLRQGRLRAGLAAVLRSIDLFVACGRPELQDSSLGAAANAYRWLGEYDRALEFSQRALELSARHDNVTDSGYTLRDRALVHLRLGDLASADTDLRQALAIADEQGIPTLRGEVVQNLGTLHAARGDHDQARAAHEEALRIGHEVGDPCLRATALNGLAVLDRAAGDPAAALPRNTEALALATLAEDRIERAHSLTGLGDTHHQLGRHDQARGHWQAAWEIYADMGTPEAGRLRERLSG